MPVSGRLAGVRAQAFGYGWGRPTSGPAFRRGVTVPAFENVSVYNVLARALGVTPAPNDGDPGVVTRVVR